MLRNILEILLNSRNCDLEIDVEIFVEMNIRTDVVICMMYR